MTVDQIQYFADEMREKQAYFGRIRMLGGEPTLHPKLEEICQILRGLVEDGHIGFLEMVTNASHMEKAAIVKPYQVKIRRSSAAEKDKRMVANLVQVPNTLGIAPKICSAPSYCGLNLNVCGFFPCSAGAGLAKLMSEVPRWQRMSVPTRPFIEEWPDLLDLCGWCFHGISDGAIKETLKCGPANYEKNTPHEAMWKHLAPWLNSKTTPKDWKLYGEKPNVEEVLS